ncbi:hypothetical protein D9M68_693520 [compost metagenome]
MDKELFFRVQQQLKLNKAHKRTAPTQYLLTGLVKCGHCGRNFNIKKHPNTGATMQCTSRARLTLDGCSNSRTIPKQVLEHIRVQTSLDAVQRALASQQLSAREKRLIELQGDLEGISKQISNLATAIAATGLIPELQDQLQSLQDRRKRMEEEKLVLERTADAPGSLQHTVALERDYLDNDPLKLNALLQQVDYRITCHEDGLIVVSGDLYPWLYHGFERKSGSYLLEHLGETIRLRMIRPEQEASLVEHNRIRSLNDSGPLNELLSLMARNNRRRPDSA